MSYIAFGSARFALIALRLYSPGAAAMIALLQGKGTVALPTPR